jgi:hypothetical protein
MNRELLGQMGACSYVIEAFRRFLCLYAFLRDSVRHGQNGQNLQFTELVFNCVWQLSFGNAYNRSLLREAGAENFLWRITNSPNTAPGQRSRGQTVLGWLKSQVMNFLLSI